MRDGDQWTLQRIKEGYRENLALWNELHPIHPEPRMGVERTELYGCEPGDVKEMSMEFCERARQVTPQLKERADRSGNPFKWSRGDPLDGLPDGMKERIEKALGFGI
jgi:hypothetical protein